MGEEWGKAPPHDLDAEAAVLSAVLIAGGEQVDAAQGVGLAAEHFYSEAHRRIFGAALELHAVGTPVDIVQIGTRLKDQGRIAQVGGLAYLTEIINTAPAVANVGAYAATVREKWARREFIRACQRAAAEGYEAATPEEARASRERLESRLLELGRGVGDAGGLVPIGVPLREAHRAMVEQHRKKAEGEAWIDLSWGFSALDEATGGQHAGDLSIVAAAPGMGKTSFLLAIAEAVGRAGRGAAIFSLEMPAVQIAQRAGCARGKVNLRAARTASMSAADWQRWTRTCAELEKLPISVDEEPGQSLEAIAAKSRAFARDLDRQGKRLGLVVVDFLGLMKLDGDNRAQALGRAANGLKGLAKQLGCHVIALSQINREIGKRENKRPLMSDLRDSGDLEAAADNVLALYRDEYYRRDSEAKGTVEVLVLKQRNGPTGALKLKFEAWCTGFDNLAGNEGGFDS